LPNPRGVAILKVPASVFREMLARVGYSQWEDLMAVTRHPLLWSLGFGLISFVGIPERALADGSSYSYKVWHSKDKVSHHGVLTIDSSSVGYSDPEDPNDGFRFSCGDFLSVTSLKAGGHGWFLQVPARWRDRELRSDEQELGTDNLFHLIQAACKNPGPPMMPANLNDVSYEVGRQEAGSSGYLSARSAQVNYSDRDQPYYSFDLTCHLFLMWTTIEGGSLDVMLSLRKPVAAEGSTSRTVLHPFEKSLSGAVIYQGIRDACATQRTETEISRRAALRREEEARTETEMAHWAALHREEEARRQTAAAVELEAAPARRKADFRIGILAALQAAEEPDPFSSIRGGFDLSASDSHQYKTSLHLPDAEKCGLLKTPPPTPTSASAWTFACMFPSTADGYEGMVKSVQSVLNLPFQPDEKAVNINQVFFADPAKPAWRFFVAKVNDATVGISVVAVRLAGAAPTVTRTAPFPTVPTMLPTAPTVSSTEPTVRDEVEKIRSGRYAPMPPAQRAAVSAPAVSGRTTMSVKNSTAYELSVFFDGPVSQKLTLAPGSSQDLDLAPGTFHVAGRVVAANVLPFYGEETYAGSARYSLEFYIR
jgi:hypothetical protein